MPTPSESGRDKDQKPKGPEPEVDEALDESFPASDPPSYSSGTATPESSGGGTARPKSAGDDSNTIEDYDDV